MAMSQIRYIGTGEAFDHRLPNTSLVYEGEQRILIDCGYSIPHALWGHSTDPNWLDAIYLSHFHADHCFGLPAVIVRMAEDGRTRELRLLGGVGSAQASQLVLETGYPGVLKKVPFSVVFDEIPPGERFDWASLALTTARSNHSIPNHSLRIQEGPISVCYSGDGSPSEATEALFSECTLLVHEAYYPDLAPKTSHASVPQVIEMANRLAVGQLHVLHLKRSSPEPHGVTVPRPGQVYVL